MPLILDNCTLEGRDVQLEVMHAVGRDTQPADLDRLSVDSAEEVDLERIARRRGQRGDEEKRENGSGEARHRTRGMSPGGARIHPLRGESRRRCRGPR